MNKLDVWQNLVPFISYKRKTSIFLPYHYLYYGSMKSFRGQTTKAYARMRKYCALPLKASMCRKVSRVSIPTIIREMSKPGGRKEFVTRVWKNDAFRYNLQPDNFSLPSSCLKDEKTWRNKTLFQTVECSVDRNRGY